MSNRWRRGFEVYGIADTFIAISFLLSVVDPATARSERGEKTTTGLSYPTPDSDPFFELRRSLKNLPRSSSAKIAQSADLGFQFPNKRGQQFIRMEQ